MNICPFIPRQELYIDPGEELDEFEEDSFSSECVLELLYSHVLLPIYVLYYYLLDVA